MTGNWRIEMLGGLRALPAGDESAAVTRFRTRNTGLLLAYLSRDPIRPHPREELIALLWPDAGTDSGRNSLRMALSSLRRLLEPAGVARGSVLRADRQWAALNPAAVDSDAARFESLLRQAEQVEADRRPALLERAVILYRGPFLSGHYEDWVLCERQRLMDLWLQALRRLARLSRTSGQVDEAVRWARRAVAGDPLDEEARRELIALLGESRQPGAALRQYQELRRTLAGLDALPSDETEAVLREALARPGPPPAAPESRCEPCETVGFSFAPRPTAPPRIPPPANRFFGRETERAALARWLAGTPVGGGREAGASRLVTITGVGGAGKTRLALETARDLAPLLNGSAWFVPLDSLTDAGRILDSIRDTLGLPNSPDADPLDQLAAAVPEGRWLLVLDNFEHLVDDGAALIARILDRLPELACLVTSRRALDLPGERLLALAPLTVPSEPLPLEQLLVDPSAALFADRAQSVRPGFQITAANAAAVSELCARLEGIPLALELAAARSAAATPARILAELGNRFDFLVSRRRSFGERHRSLRAAMEWSYRLLDAPIRSLFTDLCIFRGGWTLEAAAAVSCGPAAAAGALDGLNELCHASLITAEEAADGTGMRFRMLETVREFALEQLPPSRGAILARRHLEYFTGLAEAAEPGLRGPTRLQCLALLGTELENLRGALDWSVQDPAAPGAAGIRLAAALWHFWYASGRWSEGRRRLGAALERAGGAPSQQVIRALNAAGQLAYSQGDLAGARALLEQALGRARESGDAAGAAAALRWLGRTAQDQDDPEEACRLYREALAIRSRLGHEGLRAELLADMASSAASRQDLDTARRLWQESLRLFRRLGDRAGEAGMLLGLHRVLREPGEAPARLDLLRQSLAIFRELGDLRGIALVQGNLGEQLLQCDGSAAAACLEESVRLWRQLGHRFGLAHALRRRARLASLDGNPEQAVPCLIECLELYRSLVNPRGAAEVLDQLAGCRDSQGYSRLAARLRSSAETLRSLQAAPVARSGSGCGRGPEHTAASRAAALEDACTLAAGEPAVNDW